MPPDEKKNRKLGQKRENAFYDLKLAWLGVCLGILGSAVYDIIRSTIEPFLPSLLSIDLIAAGIAVGLLLLAWWLIFGSIKLTD